MTALVLYNDWEDQEAMLDRLRGLLPGWRIYARDDSFDPAEIQYAVTWNPPLGFFGAFPHLKCVASIGAGVDHILKDPDYPRHVPIIRAVGDGLKGRMGEYIALHVLRVHRRLAEIEAAQRAHQWQPYIEPPAHDLAVGIMGYGVLGSHAGRVLRAIGYRINSWSNTRKDEEGLTSFAGRGELPDFAAASDIVACLLPYTPETDGILNAELFAAMKPGSHLIAAGRGRHLVEDDLLAALDSGQLAGATLDVFRQEPLPESSALWTHPKILITSHSASFVDATVGAQIIADNLRRFDAGETVADLIDMARGY